MASLGAASIRAACEYPVGVQWDCFRGAEVGEEEMTRLAQTVSPASFEAPGERLQQRSEVLRVPSPA